MSSQQQNHHGFIDDTLDKTQELTVTEETLDKENGTHVQNWTVTVFLVLAWFCLGSSMEIAGPTLQDFIHMLNSNYDEVAGAISHRNIGELLGGIFGGFSMDRLGRFSYAMIAISLTTLSVLSAILPLVTNLQFLRFLYFVLGTLLGIVNIAGQRSILCIWKDKAASPLHALHMGYGIGALVSPIIANPFLGDFANFSNNSTAYTNVTGKIKIQTSEFSLYKAYIIISLYTVCISIFFYVYQYYAQNYRRSMLCSFVKGQKFLDMINPASCADGSCCFGVTILGFLFLYYFGVVGVERILGTFIRSYAIDQLQFSKSDGSYINTSFWICFAIGRFSGFILARFVSIKIIIIVEASAAVFISVLAVIFSENNALALWVLSACIGLFIGPMYPTGIGWGDFHITMTGLAITFVVLGGGVGGFVFTNLCGNLYDVYGPPSFIYLSLAVCTMISTIVLILSSISVVKRYIHKPDYQQFENVNEN